MTNRQKLIEMMKDPNSIQLALDLAKHQDIELYKIAKALLVVFLENYIGPEDDPKHQYTELSHVIRGNHLYKILFANPTIAIKKYLIKHYNTLGISLQIDKGDFFPELKINHIQ